MGVDARVQSGGVAHIEERSPDGDNETCERTIGELFGWQFTRARSTAPAIFEQLVAAYGRDAPDAGDLRALAPAPLLDRSLKRLVSIIQGDYDGTAEGAWQARSAVFELAIAQRLLLRIRSQPPLSERARWLRRFAGAAEAAMEHHYSERLLAQVQALKRPFPAAPHGRQRTHSLELCLFDFPYARNYLQLSAAERALLLSTAPPALLRDREYATLEPGDRRAFIALRSELHAAHGTARAPLREQTIAVCGCGPLPISGLMLHTSTGARVVMIDRDPSAVRAAQAWVEALERLQVLDPGAVSVSEGEVAQLDALHFDLILVASLVDAPAKLALAQQLVAARTARTHTLLFRSAGGTCAELAYEALDTVAIRSSGWQFAGESLPRHQVFTGLTPLRAAACGVSADASSEVLVIAPRQVLNSTELFRRWPHGAEPAAALQRLIIAASVSPP